MEKLPYNTIYVEYLIHETGEIQEVYKEEHLTKSEIDFINERVEKNDYEILKYAQTRILNEEETCILKLTHIERSMVEHAISYLAEELYSDGDDEWGKWMELLKKIENSQY